MIIYSSEQCCASFLDGSTLKKKCFWYTVAKMSFKIDAIFTTAWNIKILKAHLFRILVLNVYVQFTFNSQHGKNALVSISHCSLLKQAYKLIKDLFLKKILLRKVWTAFFLNNLSHKEHICKN